MVEADDNAIMIRDRRKILFEKAAMAKYNVFALGNFCVCIWVEGQCFLLLFIGRKTRKISLEFD